MLVLIRKLGEKIVIPGLEMEISLVAIQGTKVRLGVSAPIGVVVRRQEVTAKVTSDGMFDESAY